MTQPLPIVGQGEPPKPRDTATLHALADRRLARDWIQTVRTQLVAIMANDKTLYRHHETRPSDGARPREQGGTIWLTPAEIAAGLLRALEDLPEGWR